MHLNMWFCISYLGKSDTSKENMIFGSNSGLLQLGAICITFVIVATTIPVLIDSLKQEGEEIEFHNVGRVLNEKVQVGYEHVWPVNSVFHYLPFLYSTEGCCIIPNCLFQSLDTQCRV